MNFPLIPKLKLKSAEDEPSPPPVFPLSLAFPLPNPNPSSRRTTTITQPYTSGPTESLLSHIFVGIGFVACGIFATRLLSWWTRIKRWSQNIVLSLLQSNLSLIQFVSTRFLEDKGRPSKEIRDDVDEVDWGNMPPALWSEIGERITNRLDILRFRSVCEVWRSSLPFPTRFPLRVPPPPCSLEFRNMPYFITEVSVYSFNKAGLMNVAFEELVQGGKFRSRYVVPWGAKFEFSTVSFMESPKHPLSRLHFVSKAYHIRMAIPRVDSNDESIERQWDLQYNKCVYKMVIISSNVADGVNPSYARATDLTVVAHLSWGGMKGRLALLRLGGSPENWEWDTSFCSQVFEDIATFKGQLCLLDPSGRVFLMDYNSLQMTQVAPPSSLVHELKRKRLFESSGELYLVDLYKKEQLDHLKVYKLCFRRKKWFKVEENGIRVLALMPYVLWLS